MKTVNLTIYFYKFNMELNIFKPILELLLLSKPNWPMRLKMTSFLVGAIVVKLQQMVACFM